LRAGLLDKSGKEAIKEKKAGTLENRGDSDQ
jgi:hypothetical protein